MKAKFILIPLFIGLASLVSCDKNTLGQDKEKQTDPFVLVYEDFILQNDVEILSSDTTKISVSRAYLDKMQIRDLDGRTVTIWRSIGTVPFVRNIQSSKVENDKIILTTVKGELSDMFENLDVKLDSEIYVNYDYKPLKAIRSGTGAEVEDRSGKYTDANGVIHPAVVIFDPESQAVSSNAITKLESKKNYYTAEEIISSNFEFNIININSDFYFDYKFPEQDKDDDSAQIHLMGKVGVGANLTAYANIKIGFFKLKKFEAGIKGGASLAAKVGLGLKGQYEKSWEKKLANLGKSTAVFWVGPVPVPFTIESNIKQSASGRATATAQILTSANFKTSFETGCKYESGKWQSIGKGSQSSESFSIDGAEGSANLDAKCGVFFEAGLFLCGSAGPTLAFGPSITAEAGVSANLNSDKQEFTMSANYGAYAGLSAEIGAKVKVLGYTLAKWETAIDIFKVTLSEGNYEKTWSVSEWEDYRNNWMNSVKPS